MCIQGGMAKFHDPTVENLANESLPNPIISPMFEIFAFFGTMMKWENECNNYYEFKTTKLNEIQFLTEHIIWLKLKIDIYEN